MRNYQYINRERVNPIDLNVLGQTYNTLEQGHLKAVEAASELQTAMASLDLNEAEDAWRQQRINEIRQTIADNTTFGNAYGALDDIIAKRGDLTSDAGLIGRLRAQQDYKAYQQKVDSSNIPEHYKDYYKKLNPYYYQDKYDNKGNVIGGSKWESNSDPVATQDYNALMQLAIKYASPRKYEGVTNRYINEDHSITSVPKDSSSIPVLFDTTTRSIVELTKEDLRKGLEAALKASPEHYASLKQDYNIALDDYNNGQLGLYNVKSSKGGHMTFEEFKNSIFEPMYESSSYRYVSESSTPNKNISKDFTKAFGGGNDNQTEKYNIAPFGVAGETVNYQDRSFVVDKSNVDNGNSDIKRIYQEMFKNNYSEDVANTIRSLDLTNTDTFAQALPSLLGEKYKNLNVNLMDRSAVKAALVNAGENEESIISEMNYYDAVIRPYNRYRILNAEAIYNYNKFKEENEGTRKIAAINVWNDLNNGTLDPNKERNPFEERLYEETNDIMDFYFPEGSIGSGWSTTSQKDVENFKNALKTEGLVLGTDVIASVGPDGQNVYTLSTEKKNLYYKFASAIKNTRDKRNMWHKLWQDVKGAYSVKGDHIFYINENGQYISYTGMTDDLIPSVGNWLERVTRGVIAPNVPIVNRIIPIDSAAHKSRGYGRKIVDFIPGFYPIGRTIERGTFEDTGDALDPIFNLYNRFQRYSDDSLDKKETLVQNINFTGSTPQAILDRAEIDKIYESNLPADEKADLIRNLETNIKAADRYTLDQIYNSAFENCEIKATTDKGYMEPLHGEELSKLKAEFDENKENSKVNVTFDKTEGKYVHKVSFTNKEGKYKVFTVVYSENDSISDLNNNPKLNAVKDILMAHELNRSIRIGNFLGREDIYAEPLSNGTWEIKFENGDDYISQFDPTTNEGKKLQDSLIDLKYLTYKLNNFDSIGLEGQSLEELIDEYKTLLGLFLRLDVNNPDISKELDKSIQKEFISNKYTLWD